MVVRAAADDTYSRLAKRYLNNRIAPWMIAEANGYGTIREGVAVVIPRRDDNPIGVYQEGHQVVPILSYHRIDSKYSRMSVSPSVFESHIAYLDQNNFYDLTLDEINEFLLGNRRLPRRSVAITIDDGYSSAYHNAFPILKKFGVKATLFVYTDFIGQGGLTWQQINEMEASGLIDVQPHSKSHANLTEKSPGESLDQYRQRILDEVNTPRIVLESNIKETADSFAYPYGDTNKIVVDALKQSDYRLGLTVRRGSNAFFTYPFSLKRTMIFGNSTMPEFGNSLVTFSPTGAFREFPRPEQWSLGAVKKRALVHEKRGDLARALRDNRVIDAVDNSLDSRLSIWKLERKISKLVNTHIQKARTEIKAGKFVAAQESLLSALRLSPNKRTALKLLQYTVSEHHYASLSD